MSTESASTRSKSLLLGPRPLPNDFANRLFLACAYSLDPLCNRHQMEYPWYSFWTIVLYDLIAGLPEYILFPQFPVWTIPPEDNDDADYESDVEPSSPTPFMNFNPNADAFPANDSDTSSSQSSQSPQPTPPPPNRENRFKLPDFAVLGLLGDKISEVDFPLLSEALESLRSRQIINNILTPLIVEIKRDSLLSTDRYHERLLSNARFDASRQANFIFASSHQAFVVAIAAAGVQWSWSVIRRPDQLPVASPEEQGDPTYVPRELRQKKPAWSGVLHFGSADSDTAFREVFKWMMGLRRGRCLNHGSQDGVTTDVDEVDFEFDSADSQDSGASRSNEDDATEIERDRRRLTPSGDNRQSYAGPRTPRLSVPPPTDSPDPLGSYSVGESHADPRTPGPRAPGPRASGPRAPGHRAPGPRAPSALAPPTDSPDPLDTMGLPTTPFGKDTAKRNRATDSPDEAAARLTLPTCQVSPSSKPQRKRGKMHATTSSQPM